MKKSSAHFLAAKSVLMIALSVGLVAPTNAALPVIDAANITQTTIAAVKSTAAVLKQIEQYKTQLDQYENQLQNTAQPAAYIWDQAQQTIANLMTAIDTLNFYKQQLGSIDAYLTKYQDIDYYKTSPCFTEGGCTSVQLEQVKQSQRIGSQAQKKANDALFKGLDRQQASLSQDSQKLMQLQSRIQDATGQMQALQYANQLASHSANQTLQIRGLLIAQQNADASRAQAVVDKEAQENAASDQLRRGSFIRSNALIW